MELPNYVRKLDQLSMGCKLSDYALKIGIIFLILTVSIPHGALGVPNPTKSYVLTDNMNLREESTTASKIVQLMKEGISLVSFVGSDCNDLVDGPRNKKVLKRTVRTIIDGTGIETPGYLISFPKDTTAPMRLDGFTIINMPKYVSGINLFVVEVRGCSPEVVNNIVAKNRSRGGILSTGLGLGMGPPFETVARPVSKTCCINSVLCRR
jgi:hypothetical protein